MFEIMSILTGLVVMVSRLDNVVDVVDVFKEAFGVEDQVFFSGDRWLVAKVGDYVVFQMSEQELRNLPQSQFIQGIMTGQCINGISTWCSTNGLVMAYGDVDAGYCYTCAVTNTMDRREIAQHDAILELEEGVEDVDIC